MDIVFIHRDSVPLRHTHNGEFSPTGATSSPLKNLALTTSSRKEDMSSKLLRAISLMHTRLKIEGESSESLANHVNRVNHGRSDAKICTSVAALDSPMEITVADALLELARASRNPKDRSIAAIHQRWAFVRYLAFFDQSSGFLTIGEEGRSFVYNQRRVASEELGVAFSILVGRRWIASLKGPSGPVSVTDVELASIFLRGDVLV